jgi:hypothetical protein
MEIVKGIIEPGLSNGRIDFEVTAPNGHKKRYEGVILLDDKSDIIDAWYKAITFLTWREHVLKQEPCGLRVGIMEMIEKGNSRTTYIEPDDVVTGVQKHEP